jgi:hypothetical protein
MLKHVLLALNAMHVYALYMHVDMLGYLQTHTYNNCLLIAMPIKEMKLKDQRVSGFPYYNWLWSSQALIGENVILSPCTSRMTILISHVHMHDWSLRCLVNVHSNLSMWKKRGIKSAYTDLAADILIWCVLNFRQLFGINGHHVSVRVCLFFQMLVVCGLIFVKLS